MRERSEVLRLRLFAGVRVSGCFGLFGQQLRLDVGQHAALRDRDAAQQRVQLLVVPHRQLDVSRRDAELLVVAARVARQLQHLRAQVLDDRRQIHRRSGADARRVVSLPQEARDAAHRELKACAGGARHGRLGFRLSDELLTAAGHDEEIWNKRRTIRALLIWNGF